MKEYSPRQTVLIEKNLFEVEDALHVAMSDLTPRERLILTLNRIQGMTNRDISIQLVIKKRTVENHITNATRKLKHFILEIKKAKNEFLGLSDDS